MKQHDPVNHPLHYNKGGIEVIDVIEAYNLNFRLSNVIKYILRHKDKGNPIEDLEKALFYLKRDIDKKKSRLVDQVKKDADSAAQLKDVIKKRVEDYRNETQAEQRKNRSKAMDTLLSGLAEPPYALKSQCALKYDPVPPWVVEVFVEEEQQK